MHSELMEERQKSFLWMKTFVKIQHAENHGGMKASFHGKKRMLRESSLKCSLSWVSESQAGLDRVKRFGPKKNFFFQVERRMSWRKLTHVQGGPSKSMCSEGPGAHRHV